MKSKIKNEVLEFPCLMQNDNGDIVLMTKPYTGIILGGDEIGCISYTWDMNDFSFFDGKLELSND